MKIIKSILLVLYLFFSFQLVAQNSLQLETVLDSIETIMEKRKIPGLLLSIVTRDSVLYDGGLGMSNLEKAEAVNATQLFRMGSITKSVAAIAMLQLEAEGHFSLLDNLKEVAPEISFNNKWADIHPLKIIHLLEHTAGFDDLHPRAGYTKNKQELSTLEMVKLNKGSLIPRWQPGTRMAYSNSGYVLLTFLIEKFSGQSYHDYIQQKVFAPIGMHQSNLTFDSKKATQYAKSYRYKANRFETIPFQKGPIGLAGNLNSCSADMTKFIQLFLNDGKVNNKVVLPTGSIERMETASTSLATKKGRVFGNYGLGIRSHYTAQPFPVYGHGGDIDGFRSKFIYNKKLGFGFAFSANTNTNVNNIVYLLIEFLTQNFTPPTPKITDLDIEFVKPYLGYYQLKSPRYQMNYLIKDYFEGFELKLINDKLYTVDMWGKKRKLTPTAPNLFRPSWGKLATTILTENESGKKVFINNNYYEKSSLIGIWIKRIAYGGALTISSTFSFFALIWLISSFFRKEKSPAISTITSFFLSCLAIGLCIFFAFLITKNPTEAGEFNWKTATYFLSTIGFGIGSLAGTYFLWKSFSSLSSKMLKYYLVLVALSFLGLSIYLTWHGIIGMQLWSY